MRKQGYLVISILSLYNYYGRSDKYYLQVLDIEKIFYRKKKEKERRKNPPPLPKKKGRLLLQTEHLMQWKNDRGVKQQRD